MKVNSGSPGARGIVPEEASEEDFWYRCPKRGAERSRASAFTNPMHRYPIFCASDFGQRRKTKPRTRVGRSESVPGITAAPPVRRPLLILFGLAFLVKGLCVVPVEFPRFL